MRRILAILAVAIAGVVSVGGSVGGAPDGTDGTAGQPGSGGRGSVPGQPGEPGRPGESGGSRGGGNGGNGGNGDGDGEGRNNDDGGGNNDGGNNNNDGGGNDGGNNSDGGNNDGGNNNGENEGPTSPDGSLTVGPDAQLGEDPHDVTLTVELVCPNDARYMVLAKARQNKAVSQGTTVVQCDEGAARTVTIETTDPNRRFEAGEAEACVAVAKPNGAVSTPVCRTVTVAAAETETT